MLFEVKQHYGHHAVVRVSDGCVVANFLTNETGAVELCPVWLTREEYAELIALLNTLG